MPRNIERPDRIPMITLPPLNSGRVFPRQEIEGLQLTSTTLLLSSRMKFIPLPETILAGCELKEWRIWELEMNQSMAATGPNFVGSIWETNKVRHRSREMDDVGGWRFGVLVDATDQPIRAGPAFSRLFIPTEVVYCALGLYGAGKEVGVCCLSAQKGSFGMNILHGKPVR